MRVLGIDPGATTGWCLYVDSDAGRYVEQCGQSSGTDVLAEAEHAIRRADVVAIERPKGYGPTYPQVVEAAYVCGYIAAALGEQGIDVHEIVRRDVCALLTDSVHGVVRVKNDATAWAALVLLHGDGADRKPKRKKGVVVDAGGPLGSVTSHARAALAVAVAYVLMSEVRA